MKLSTIMTANAVIAAAFAIGFLVAPGAVLAVYGASADPAMAALGRLFGGALAAFAVLTWTARNAPPSSTRRAIVFALFVGDAVGFVAALAGQLSGAYNALGWSTVVIYLLFAVGYGYFVLTEATA